MTRTTPHAVTLNVTLIASTQVHATPQLERRTPFDAEHLTEFAGRNCYQSWHRPNPATAEPADYVGNIREKLHFSVMEHATATFHVEGVSRALTHELIRHRHLSPSQLSMRFVHHDGSYVLPPLLRDATGPAADQLRADIDAVWVPILDLYNQIYDFARGRGYTLKESREAARSVLPHMTETRIVISGNHRAFREMVGKRDAHGADAEIRELAQALLGHLSGLAPAIYADMTEAGQ
ncbi:FAD-dependent thymidylate synthase [Nocardiopsis terrae]|uniref:FAD-dependent thymidylate synthase n=1 Tax=Streptomyces sp. NPDC057554 TaxID=3350538 RepID=UPI003681170F